MMHRYFKNLMLAVLLMSASVVPATELSIVVNVPAVTPDAEKVCITGNHELLTGWSGAGVPLQETGPGLHQFRAEIPDGTVLEFKFTRGSFATVEKTAQGLERPNRRLLVKGDKMVERAVVEAWSDQNGNGAANQAPKITGNYKILRQVKSAFLKPARDVIIWLPPSYDKPGSSGRRYPVIYMHDGGNLFDPGTSFGGVDWGIDEAMDEGIARGELKEAIVVGIGNTADRMSEYTPFPDPKHAGGNGEKYARFLVEELKPLVDRSFRTLKDRHNTFVGGSSLGGLISLYIGISRPKVFSGIIAMSPSIWWSNGGIIEWLLQNNLASWPGQIWADMGTREGEEAVRFSRQLAATIKQKCPAFKGLVYREFSGGSHSETSWKQRIHMPLRLFIGRRK